MLLIFFCHFWVLKTSYTNQVLLWDPDACKKENTATYEQKTGEDDFRCSSSYPSLYVHKWWIQPYINEKLEESESEIFSNIAKFEPNLKKRQVCSILH